MPENNHYDLIIVGGGIIGAATFFEFQKKYPDQRVLILEKESTAAAHQTGRNSGVIHSGIYYKPGSIKARNCRQGLRLLYDFCSEYEIPHDNCGKLIVATNESEVSQLDQLRIRGEKNGLKGLELLDGNEAREFEPYVSCLAALHVSETGIVDYKVVTEKLIELGTKLNTKSVVKYDQQVTQCYNKRNISIVHTRADEYKAEKVIFCAGLNSDRFARMDGVNVEIRVIPFRGDYYILKPNAFHKVKNLIYPVANPSLPFLGVHLTRMMNGSVECGPNAVFSFDREGYRKLSFKLNDASEALTFQGTWKLFANYWKVGLNEYYRAFSKQRFLESLQKMIPSLKMDDLGQQRAGVRAQVVGRDGNLIDDFLIKKGECGIHIINAPSPAATACLSIGKSIVDKID